MSPPASWYVDDDHFAREIERIHRRNWFLFGRTDELARPGDYRAIDTVGGPVVVVRGEDGLVRAFANSCRHRGAPVATGAGCVRTLTCPYHAWVYKLDGSLLAAPAMSGAAEGFARRDWGLRRIRAEDWKGFLFLNFDEEAPSLLDHLGAMAPTLASHRPEDMVTTWRMDLEVRCNWKLSVENAIEAYHTGTVHALTVGAQRSVEMETAGNWASIQVLSDSSIAVLGDAPPPLPSIDGLDAGARRGTYFTLLMPATQLAAAQDCIWWLAVRPVATARSVLSLGGCFPRATTQLPDFERHARLYYDRWEKVAREDTGMLESQQAGLGSVLHTPGPMSPRESALCRLYDWLDERMA
ncbi:MAG: aromatic ring-hydroxylating oxygenase subunit alpha [Alphaproteobacteria bacterium]